MRKIRVPHFDDLEKTEKAYRLILDIIIKNQNHIEPALWVGGCLSALAENYKNSGHSYENFVNEMEQAIIFYKRWWE